MSDRVSAGAPNGVRIEDDATKLYDEFAGIDLAFVADHLVSISATDATAEEAFAIKRLYRSDKQPKECERPKCVLYFFS